MSFNYKYIKIQNIAALRKIVISNPKKRNSLNTVAYTELTDALNKAAVDDSLAIVALTGEGDYYSSGNDLSGFLTVEDPQKALADSYAILKNLIRAFYTFPKPLICVVNGPCIGIAATTAVLSDVVYAVESAYFYTPFSLLGLCAEGCASYTFPRVLGKSKANEMLLFNHKLSSSEAYQFNLVSEIFKKSELDTTLWPKIENFAKLSKDSLRVTKKLIAKFELKDLEDACDRELNELFKRFDSDDFMNAIATFMGRKSKL